MRNTKYIKAMSDTGIPALLSHNLFSSSLARIIKPIIVPNKARTIVKKGNICITIEVVMALTILRSAT